MRDAGDRRRARRERGRVQVDGEPLGEHRAGSRTTDADQRPPVALVGDGGEASEAGRQIGQRRLCRANDKPLPRRRPDQPPGVAEQRATRRWQRERETLLHRSAERALLARSDDDGCEGLPFDQVKPHARLSQCAPITAGLREPMPTAPRLPGGCREIRHEASPPSGRRNRADRSRPQHRRCARDRRRAPARHAAARHASAGRCRSIDPASAKKPRR